MRGRRVELLWPLCLPVRSGWLPTFPGESGSIAGWREYRNNNRVIRRVSQLMQVVATLVRCRRSRGIPVDHRAEQGPIVCTPELHPARAARWDHAREPRRRPREGVAQRSLELAWEMKEAEAESSFQFIEEKAENVANALTSYIQPDMNAIDYQQRVVAIPGTQKVVNRQHTCQSIVSHTVEPQNGGFKPGEVYRIRAIDPGDRFGAKIGLVAARQFDVLIADQLVEADREAVSPRGYSDNETRHVGVKVRGSNAGCLAPAQANDGVGH